MKIFRKDRLSDAAITQWLTALRANPYVPESGYAATAVFRARVPGADDCYFAGVNVENVDHRLSTHGEEGAIAAMVTGLGKYAEIAEGWVMGAPQNLKADKHSPAADALVSCCGKCRQQIAGFAGENVKIHYVALNGQMSTTTVGAFLPEAFTLRRFSEEKKSVTKEGSAEEIENRLLRKEKQTEKEIVAWLKGIDSVDYLSKISQAVVLELDNGCYAAGAKIEDAAFLSVNAAQSALAIATAGFGACAIREAWVFTKGRDGKEIPPDSFGGLTLSALQTLLQRAAHAAIPVRFLAGDGGIIRMTLSEAARLAASGSIPLHKKP
jgi:cytidine deaminase